jgi:flagellar biosynthetic protein FliQ
VAADDERACEFTKGHSDLVAHACDERQRGAVVSDADVTQIAAQTMMVAAKVAAPVLVTALLVGFLISLFQAATQIQEPTLSFVPKMIAVAIALLVTGNWVLAELVSFTNSLFDQLPRLLDRT